MSKRDDYISWSEFFMFSAAVAAQRSKDPCTQVGATVVNSDNRIISSGYNGFCTGISDDIGLWGKGSEDPKENKHMYVVHAEANAIVSARQDCRGCTVYITHFPCNGCALLLIQAGITKVVYAKEWGKEKDTTAVSRYLLEAAGVELEQYGERTSLHVTI